MDKTEIILNNLIESILNYDDLSMREYEQTLWRNNSSFEYISEPCMSDPVRYVLTCAVLMEIRNIWFQKNSTEINIPEWVYSCPSLASPFSVISKRDILFWKDEECNETFSALNIFAPKNYLSFY